MDRSVDGVKSGMSVSSANGAGGETRTHDLGIMRPSLYPWATPARTNAHMLRSQSENCQARKPSGAGLWSRRDKSSDKSAKASKQGALPR